MAIDSVSMVVVVVVVKFVQFLGPDHLENSDWREVRANLKLSLLVSIPWVDVRVRSDVGLRSDDSTVFIIICL